MAAHVEKIYTDAAKTMEATPQQIYDAYMAGTALLNLGTSETASTVTRIISMAYNGTPDNIESVNISYYDDESGAFEYILTGNMGGK